MSCVPSFNFPFIFNTNEFFFSFFQSMDLSDRSGIHVSFFFFVALLILPLDEITTRSSLYLLFSKGTENKISL